METFFLDTADFFGILSFFCKVEDAGTKDDFTVVLFNFMPHLSRILHLKLINQKTFSLVLNLAHFFVQLYATFLKDFTFEVNKPENIFIGFEFSPFFCSTLCHIS